MSGVVLVSSFVLSVSVLDVELVAVSSPLFTETVLLLSLESVLLLVITLSRFLLPVVSVCVDVCCSGGLLAVKVTLCELLSSEGFGESPEPDHNSEPEPERSLLLVSLSSRLSFVKLVALGSLKISPSKASGALRRSTADAAGCRKSEISLEARVSARHMDLT